MRDSNMCIDFEESHNHSMIFRGHCQIMSKADEKCGNFSFMPVSKVWLPLLRFSQNLCLSSRVAFFAVGGSVNREFN